MKKPLLSICIPTYNRADILQKTIQKFISCSSFNDEVEIIISDNCSTDKTKEVCRKFTSVYENIKYFCNDENLKDRNFFLALERASGTYRKLNNDYMCITDSALAEIKDLIKKNLDRIIYISGGYLYTKVAKDINFCESPSDFIKCVSTYTTYVGFFGIWEQDITKIKEPYKFSELLLNQVDWIYQYLTFNPKSVIYNKKNTYEIVTEITEQKRCGYNWFSVHVKNYYDILKYHEHIFSGKDIFRDKDYCLKHFKSELKYVYIYKPRLWDFETKGTSKILFDYFHNIPRFYLYIFFLPFMYVLRPWYKLKDTKSDFYKKIKTLLKGHKTMNTDINLKILVCCHKKTNLPSDTQDILLPIQVGASKSVVDLGFQKDNTLFGKICDNISEKNNIYCELTAMYWAWKNIKIVYPEINYIGLCHYRRFFYAKRDILRESVRYLLSVIKPLLKLFSGQTNHSNHIFTTEYVCDFDDAVLKKSNKIIKEIATNYDIITTIPIRLVDTDVRDFFNVVGRIYINLAEKIVKESFSEYYETLEKVLNGNKLSCTNMLICKVEMLDEYCSFIFGVLEKHLELVKLESVCLNPEKEGIYSRVSGYLAEFLTYTYIVKKSKDGAKIKYLNKIFINNPTTSRWGGGQQYSIIAFRATELVQEVA